MRVQDIQKGLAQSRFGIKPKPIARLPVGVEKVAIHVAIAKQIIELEPCLLKNIETCRSIGCVPVVVVQVLKYCARNFDRLNETDDLVVG